VLTFPFELPYQAKPGCDSSRRSFQFDLSASCAGYQADSSSYILLLVWPLFGMKVNSAAELVTAIGAHPMVLRRSVIFALGAMPLLACGVFAQAPIKARRVGLLASGAPYTDTSELVIGLKAGFSKRGYVSGSSLLFEQRAAEGKPDRLPRLVDDLKSEVELIITNSGAVARVLKDRSNIPVVAITGADPVATG
jgi:hypothetical protein